MKKVLAFLLASSMLMMMGGCSSSDSGSTGSTDTAGTTTPSTSTPDTTTGGDTSDYPNKPVEVTVQWGAGGGADLVYRALAEVFPTYANGQPLVVNNVEGASGVTGSTEFMTSASPDGYQFIHINTAHLTKIHMSEVPYDATTFVPVAEVAEIANYLLVQADAPWQTLDELIADAKANPGSITLGNAGIGGGNHIGSLLFEQAAEVEFAHIAYSGGGNAVTGILSGEVDLIMANAPEGLTNVESGQLRILANFGSERFARFPDLPTAQEDGFDLVIDQWRGVAVPAGTPDEIIAKLNDILKQCIEDPTYIEMMTALDARPAYKDTADFTAFVTEEDARFQELIQSNGLGDRYT
ncbi:MAG: tripartite tricarboxylate transporter substrate binding protein [Eubacteriales bacterium]